jgi:hypothetical protein
MNSSEHIQAAVDPRTLRGGRPIVPIAPLQLPRIRRLRPGQEVPAVTRRVPTVEIMAGAVLGLLAGLLLNIGRWSIVDLGWGMIFGALFGLLIGWLIGSFTGATGTLTWRTVLTNMVHIVWVLTVCIFLAGIMMLLAALADAAYGRTRQDF